MKTHTKQLLMAACLSGALAVGLGAFGAHGLKEVLEESLLKAFNTGVRYQFFHVFALALAAWVYEKTNGRFALVSGGLFLAGSVLFSGSLYAMALLDWSFLGIVTPFGGVSFIAGWLVLAVGVSRITASD